MSPRRPCRNIAANFHGVPIREVVELSIVEMLNLLANEPLVVVTKQSKSHRHSTTAYDARTQTIYRAIHSHGLKGMVKELALENESLRILGNGEPHAGAIALSY